MYNYACLIVISIGALIAIWQIGVLWDKEIVYGSVIETPEKLDSEGDTTYGVVARFSNNNAEYQYRSKWYSNSKSYSVGDRVKIYFDRHNPADCGMCSFGYRFGVAFLFALAGAVMLAGKYGFIFGNVVMDYVYPVTRG
ncbi:MAG TPA: DUF3592 domain-containing protein [Blastocatellia bacterium]|nr:DUF3592 domain-containing protein [Blastocatellia bacterium]